MPKVLLVSRDERSAASLAAALHGDFRCDYVDASKAFHSVATSLPDLVLLDAPVPDAGWLLLCRSLRQLTRAAIVFSSLAGREPEIVRAFDAGADDFLVMPMRPAEMAARLRAVTRRASEREDTGGAGGDVITAGDLAIFLDRHEVRRDGKSVDLSPIEFRLLVSLASQPGRSVSHSRLLASVWGPEYVECRHYLRLYVRYLRSKLEEDPANPEMILNEWGVGYRFQPKAS